VQEIKGTLYIVATPIGNLGDITHRAIQTLTEANKIYAEDTRNSRKLLTHYDIRTPLTSLHEHNEKQRINEIRAALENGENIALISDAGTPLISDPGYKLVHEIGKTNLKITPIPGASAIITALSVAGLPTDKFTFEGFLPAKPQNRIQTLKANLNEKRTQVYYESSHRITASIENMCEIMGEEREVTLARELTKVYEQLFRGTLTELKHWIKEDPNRTRGEFVVIIKGNTNTTDSSTNEINTQHLLKTLINELPIKQAANIAAKLTGEKKNKLYKMAMEIKQNQLPI
jgi:16S rRNA (cytidine1402-2'-O)-methyltransferase